MHVTLNQADQQVQFFDEEELSDIGFDAPARLVVRDTTTGEAVSTNCSATAFAAIVWLALVGENGGADLTTTMYAAANPVVDSLPNNLRPIP